MFEIQQLDGGVTKLVVPEVISGDMMAVEKALAQHATHPKLIIDWSAFKRFDGGGGFGWIPFLQRRGTNTLPTRNYGIDDTVKAANWAECFLHFNSHELAESEADAIAKVGG